MEIKKKNQHFTVEVSMTEAEVQTIVSVFEDLCVYRNLSYSEMKGLRGEVYKSFEATLHHQ